MDAGRRIIKCRVNLLLDNPFFGNIAMNFKIQKDNNMYPPSMGVDLYGHLYYCEEFVDKLTDEELKFVMCHEIMHIAMHHLTRSGTRDQWKWNVAIDYATNGILKVTQGVGTMPEKPGAKGLYDDKFDGMCAERIYAMLPEDQQQQVQIFVYTGGGSGEGGSGQDQNSPSDGKGEKEGETGHRRQGNGKPNAACAGLDIHIMPNPSNDPTLNSKEIRAMEDEWQSVVARAATVARMRGILPGGVEEIINEFLVPKVDWRTVLWQFISEKTKEDYRWYPPNRRYIQMGLNLPSMHSETFEIAVAVDTSGSISSEDLKQFLSEVQSILEIYTSCTVHYMECDADVHRYEEYHAGDQLDGKVTGRGGTSFKPVFREIEKRDLTISCLVYLTDTEGDFPKEEPQYPTLWIVNHKDGKVPFGEMVVL